jgi:hypothetical protein
VNGSDGDINWVVSTSSVVAVTCLFCNAAHARVKQRTPFSSPSLDLHCTAASLPTTVDPPTARVTRRVICRHGYRDAKGAGLSVIALSVRRRRTLHVSPPCEV